MAGSNEGVTLPSPEQAMVAKLTETARKAGQLLLQFRAEGKTGEADMASQELIVKAIRNLGRKEFILGEEGSEDTQELPDTYWSVDPLDGSAVYANDCPEFAVSIALIENGEPKLAVIHLPAQGITITAIKGRGCFVNGERVAIPTPKDPRESLIGLDFAKAVNPEFDGNVNVPLTKAFRYVRNQPSVASGVELLQGRTIAWVSSNARNWDVAAVALAITEAGGIVQCLDGKPIPWDQVKLPPLLFAANPEIAQYVRSKVKQSS